MRTDSNPIPPIPTRLAGIPITRDRWIAILDQYNYDEDKAVRHVERKLIEAIKTGRTFDQEEESP